ncbi:hypothetical protein H8E88_01085 [candidate division KSB1 bacterium]|nr:hypothetical protein [candidate division KSB1 bacterium]
MMIFGSRQWGDKLTNLGTINDERRTTLEKNKTMNEKLGLRFRSTQDIVDAAYAGKLPDKIMITVHPQRWSDSFFPWMKELVWQNFKNMIKWGIVRMKDQYNIIFRTE